MLFHPDPKKFVSGAYIKIGFFRTDSDFWTVFRKDIYYKEDLSGRGLNERQIKAVLYVKEKGRITNGEYQEINEIFRRTATTELIELVDNFNLLKKKGTAGSSVVYEVAHVAQ